MMDQDMWILDSETPDADYMESFKLDLLKANNAENDSNNEEEFYSHSPDADCCTNVDGWRNSPTLAELNGPIADEYDWTISPFEMPYNKRHKAVSAPYRRSSAVTQVMDVDRCKLNRPVVSACQSENLHADNKSKLPAFISAPIASVESSDFDFFVVNRNVKVETPFYVETTVDTSSQKKADLNSVPSNLKKRSLTNVHDLPGSVITGCSDASSTQSATDHNDLLSRVKDESPCKKIKTEVEAVEVTYSASSPKECSRSSANQTDDSDIENFDDNVSEDGTTAGGADNSSESSTDSCVSMDLQKRYFWLYNVQAKGPKGRPTLGGSSGISSESHTEHSFDDSIASDMSARGRRSKCSDLDANPRRLLQIGAEIHRLSVVVNRPSGASEASLSPREKNKYASRICRLKRKAQHEANKIKLQGLDYEYGQLMSVLGEIKSSIVDRVRDMQPVSGCKSNASRLQTSLTVQLESLVKTHLSDMIAEHTNEYVSCELQKVKSDNKSHRV